LHLGVHVHALMSRQLLVDEVWRHDTTELRATRPIVVCTHKSRRFRRDPPLYEFAVCECAVCAMLRGCTRVEVGVDVDVDVE
jgi:hypothetical protein